MATETRGEHEAPVHSELPVQVDHAERSGQVDEDMLALAITWLPYGGAPAEDVWVMFGLTPDRYRRRLRDVVERNRARIHPLTVQRLFHTV